jgi:hypothetical protein
MAVLVISYSRQDQHVIRAVVSLLRTALKNVDEAVFWDEDFEPGDPWFEQIKTHINATPQLFVFWCDHSSVSDQVRREFLYAVERNKRVVPVLLDDTPLVAELAPMHGIDLRSAIKHTKQYALFSEWIATAGIAAALIVVLGISAFWRTSGGESQKEIQVPATASTVAAPDPSPAPTSSVVAPPAGAPSTADKPPQVNFGGAAADPTTADPGCTIEGRPLGQRGCQTGGGRGQMGGQVPTGSPTPAPDPPSPTAAYPEPPVAVSESYQSDFAGLIIPIFSGTLLLVLWLGLLKFRQTRRNELITKQFAEFVSLE